MTLSPALSEKIESLADLEALATQFGGRASRGEIDLLDAAQRLWDVARSSGLAARHGDDVVEEHLFAAFSAADLQIKFDSALQSEHGLVVTRMTDIEMRAIEWLWPDRIAIGKLTEFAGQGGVGKSTLLFDIAARVSRGEAWPDNPARGAAQSVFILSAEDDPADTIKPRLQAAGADMDKVFFLSMIRLAGGTREFNLQADIARLEERVRQIGDVGLVEVDPLTAYLGKANAHSAQAVRRVLKPLGDMAARTRVAVLGSNHFSKIEGRSALLRILGGTAFVNAPRLVHIVTEDAQDKDRRLLLPAKANLTGRKTGLAFRIQQTALADSRNILATRIAWDGEPVTVTADEALAALKQNAGGRTLKAGAIVFLREALADGPKPAREVAAQAAEAGYTRNTILSAREALGIHSTKSAMNGGWIWTLPKLSSSAEESHSR